MNLFSLLSLSVSLTGVNDDIWRSVIFLSFYVFISDSLPVTACFVGIAVVTVKNFS